MVTSPVRATVTLQQRHQGEEESSNEEANDLKLLRVTIQNNDNIEDNGMDNIYNISILTLYIYIFIKNI